MCQNCDGGITCGTNLVSLAIHELGGHRPFSLSMIFGMQSVAKRCLGSRRLFSLVPWSVGRLPVCMSKVKLFGTNSLFGANR